jgi:hypothetical protein
MPPELLTPSVFALAAETEMPSPFVVWVPTLVGIVILIACFAWLRKLPALTALQVIKVYGVDLEISLLALFVLLGVGMTLTGPYLFVLTQSASTMAGKLSVVSKERDDWKEVADRSRVFTLTFYLRIPGDVSVGNMNLNSFRCRYLLPASQDWTEETVSPGITDNDVKCVIVDLPRDSSIAELQLVELGEKGERKIVGQAGNLSPFRRPIDLVPSPRSQAQHN